MHPSCQALTVGQLAKRWGISTNRVRQLVEGGYLPGVFMIPSAGRYGTTLKIPLATVIQVERKNWALLLKGEQASPKPRRRPCDSNPALRHFPALAP
jgi:hypothetical protein